MVYLFIILFFNVLNFTFAYSPLLVKPRVNILDKWFCASLFNKPFQTAVYFLIFISFVALFILKLRWGEVKEKNKKLIAPILLVFILFLILGGGTIFNKLIYGYLVYLMDYYERMDFERIVEERCEVVSQEFFF